MNPATWMGLDTDATPRPPPRPKGFRFFLHGCAVGVMAGAVGMCGVLAALAAALAGVR